MNFHKHRTQRGYANGRCNVPRLTQIISGGATMPETTYTFLYNFGSVEIRLALPLMALQYHEVKINIEFNELKDCCFYLYNGTD